MSTTESTLMVVILGCGRVGSTLAKQLSGDGHAVTVVDLTSDSFRRLGNKFRGQKLVGSGLDQDTLNKARLSEADIFIAVTQGDNTNIMAAQLAREVYAIPKVVARIYDPIRAQAYRQMGITTFCTTTVAAGLIRGAVLNDEALTPWQRTAERWDQDYLDQAGL